VEALRRRAGYLLRANLRSLPPQRSTKSAGLVCIAQASRNIDRDDIETDTDIR
jgi:hypothetical protein